LSNHLPIILEADWWPYSWLEPQWRFPVELRRRGRWGRRCWGLSQDICSKSR